MKKPEKKRLTGLGMSVFIFLGIETIGIIFLAICNFKVRPIVDKIYEGMGLELPPITLLGSVTAVVAICISFIVLGFMWSMIVRRMTKTTLTLSVLGLPIIILELFSLHAPYWELLQLFKL